MFKEINIENFKSLDDITIDLTDYASWAKNFAAIYGESGSGKSNIIEAIHMLREAAVGYDTLPCLYRIGKGTKETHPISLSAIIVLGEDRFKYGIQFWEDGNMYEFLDYLNPENKHTYFENVRGCLRITDKELEDYLEENNALFQSDVARGSRSFLNSLEALFLNHEVKADSGPLENIQKVVDYFKSIEINWTYEENRRAGNFKGLDIWTSYREEAKGVDKLEDILNQIFPNINPDITNVHYREYYPDSGLRYVLYYKRRIGNHSRFVPYWNEADGINATTNLIVQLLKAINGKTVILDDFDNFIPSSVIKQIMNNVVPNIKGQLILTAHDTSLMDCEIERDNFYTIDLNSAREKEVYHFGQFDDEDIERLGIREAYEAGLFGGTWAGESIDFSEYVED